MTFKRAGLRYGETPEPVIPPNLRLDLKYPRIGSQQAYAADLGAETVPRGAGGICNRLIIGKKPVREKALLEVEPHALDRVQLGRIRWQRQQRDVVGYAQIT